MVAWRPEARLTLALSQIAATLVGELASVAVGLELSGANVPRPVVRMLAA